MIRSAVRSFAAVTDGLELLRGRGLDPGTVHCD
jgi:hypothetical protein